MTMAYSRRKIEERIPVSYMTDSVIEYIETGVLHGNFLTALFQNDLMGAFRCADGENAAMMDAWTKLLYNWTPAGCWGSVEKVQQWADGGGLNGRLREA